MIPGEPIDLSLREPHPERLEQLATTIHGVGWNDLQGEDRAELYKLALGEMAVSALGVLAQFCVRMTNG